MPSPCSRDFQQEIIYFVCWQGGIACFFAGLSAALLAIHECYVVDNGKEERWMDFIMTFVLLFLFLRTMMHHTALQFLQKWSQICKDLPHMVQQDAAFAVVDNLSLALWGPLVVYSVVKVFELNESEEFFRILQPGLKMVFTCYLADRILHIWVNPSCPRAAHHFGVMFLILLTLEWNSSNASPCVFIYGIVDVFNKPVITWHSACRFARYHSKKHPDWSKDNLNQDALPRGIDRLWIEDRPQTMAAWGKFFAGYTYFTGILLPFALVVLYLVQNWQHIHLVSRILQASFPIFFLGLDWNLYLDAWRKGTLAYWKQDFGGPAPAATYPKQSNNIEWDGGLALGTELGSSDLCQPEEFGV